MKLFALPMIIFFALTMPACKAELTAQAASPASPGGIHVFDSLGRKVSLAQPATRIVSLSPGFTEILFAVGCGKQVIVRDVWSDYPEAAKSLPAVDSVAPSVIGIAGFHPDLVLQYFNDARNVEAMEALGISVAVFDPGSYDAVARTVEKIGILCGRAEAATVVANRMRAVAEEMPKGRAGRPTVYIEVDATDMARPWTAGEGSFVDELVRLAGGINAVTGLHAPYARVPAEEVLRAEPDVVLLAGVESGKAVAYLKTFVARPGFRSMKAVQREAVIADIDRDILTRVGPRLADALVALHAEFIRLDIAHAQ